MNREKNLETCLAIATGLIVFFLIYKVSWLLFSAFSIGIIGLFFNKVAGWINWLWYKIADAMGFVMSRVLLTIVFFVILFPIALTYRIFNKDTLQLKRKSNSYWSVREHEYTSKDLENVW